MKKCELCKKGARMYCDSDQASLCWDCDSRVHAANFIVAKHTRTLLCRACQAPTPWTGSGPRLGPTVALCGACLAKQDLDMNRNGDLIRTGNAENDEDDDSDGGGENQVVPWSLTPSVASSSENSCGFSSSNLGFCNNNGKVEPEGQKNSLQRKPKTWKLR